MAAPPVANPVVFVDPITGLPLVGGSAGPYAGWPVVSVDQSGVAANPIFGNVNNAASLQVTAPAGSGSGVNGKGIAFATGAGGGGNAAGGPFTITMGPGTGTGATGQIAVTSTSQDGQTAMGVIHSITHTFSTLTAPYGTANSATRIFDVTANTDASAFGYTNIVSAFIAHVNLNGAAGSNIGKAEAISGVINITNGSAGDLGSGTYATDGEILHNSTQTITGTLRAVQGSFQVNSSGSFTTTYGIEGVITNTLGQTGTYVGTAQGARGYVENNATVAYALITAASGEVNHTAAGTVTGAAQAVLGWIHHSANVTYSGTVYGVQGLVQMSNTATNANTVYAGQFLLQFSGSAAGGSTNAAVNAEVQNSGVATTNTLNAVNVRWRVNANITQVTAIGVNVMAPNFSNTPTVTTGYGVRVGDMSTTGSGTVSTSYGIRVENQAAASATAYSLFLAGGRISMTNTNGGGLITSTSQALTVSTTTSGTLAVTSAGLLTLTGVGASVWTPGAGATVVSDTVTGIKIGTGITEKLGFYNAAPIAQRAGAAQAAVVTTATTQTTPFGFATQAQGDAIVALVNELRAWAVQIGFIKGSA